MNRELGKTFQAFVLEGRIPFPFETPLEDVQQAMGTSTTYTIDQKYGTCSWLEGQRRLRRSSDVS
ncbi:hypothetical protein [Paenibacillus massiliensis]|uniref:hypothetical protein n=1 Tax=Paenibacillus massiliensis TaxID=225917 RepID=UPI00040F0BE7|nr:hypothetical protein [Paenibacillus massiliensis]